MPRVTIQVAPAIALPTHTLLMLADGAAYCEHGAGGYVRTDPVVAGTLSARFEALRGECYRAWESRDIIEARRESYERQLAYEHPQRHEPRGVRGVPRPAAALPSATPPTVRVHAERARWRVDGVPGRAALAAITDAEATRRAPFVIPAFAARCAGTAGPVPG